MNPSQVVNAVANSIAVPANMWSVPILIGILGLPGVGKTEVTRWLSNRYPMVVLSTDSLRLQYQLPSGPATHETMYEVASQLLPQKMAVIFDGIHMQRHNRMRLRQFADSHGAHSEILYVTARPSIVAERLSSRQLNAAQTQAEGKFVITPDHFARIASMLEEPTPAEWVWRVDSSTHDLHLGLKSLCHILDILLLDKGT